MTANKNVPALRFPEFHADWRPQKLGEIAELTSSKRVFLSDYTESGIPFYRGKEISELRNGNTPSEVLYISESAFNEFESRFGAPIRNDILITAVGTLGNVYRIRDNYRFYFKDGNLIWLRKITEDSSFLEFALEWNKEAILKSSIGSTQKALTIVELKKLNLNIPSLPEQQKIAAFLTAVDEKLQQLTCKKALLEQYKKGVMQQLFSREIRFRDDNGKEFPEWEEKALGEIGDVKMCRRVFNEETSQKGDVPFYKIGSFGKEAYAYISWELYQDYRNRFSFPKKGDILISAAGTIGRLVVYNGEDAYYQDSNIVWIDNNNESVLNEFLFYVLQIVKFNTEGGTVQRLYNNILKSAFFERPCIAEQQKIASFLSAIDDKINQVTTQLQQAREFKQGLLQGMFV